MIKTKEAIKYKIARNKTIKSFCICKNPSPKYQGIINIINKDNIIKIRVIFFQDLKISSFIKKTIIEGIKVAVPIIKKRVV